MNYQLITDTIENGQLAKYFVKLEIIFFDFSKNQTMIKGVVQLLDVFVQVQKCV